MKHLAAVTLACCLLAARLPAEDLLGAQFRAEGASFSSDCIHPSGSAFAAIGGCAQLLFTGDPLHIAVGSLAPQNGFGAGLALTTHYTPNENWRLFWDLDGVAAPNGSWRGGGYMTAVLIRHPKIVVLPGGGASKKISGPKIEAMPAFHLYAQGISLNNVTYFGLGQGSAKTAESWFGMRETVVGANAVVPVPGSLNLSLFGEANGRFTAIRGDYGESNPSIGQLYTESTAPGLLQQPAYTQFGEGIQLSPTLANGHVQFNYSLAFQEWIAGSSGGSFQRFKADLSHVFPLYSGMRSLSPREFNGPDSCKQDVNAKACPPITRNLEGSFGLEFMYTASFVSAGSSVPFYLDPTIGGSDINGTTLLPSYADYRFRGPDLMLFRASFEHSIYKWPVGAKFMVDEGRVGMTTGDLGFDHLAHSYAAGLTVHAGGLPVIDLLFAWGGHEGNHTIATVDNALLGGSSRPPLQ
jgi:hypothetical protein